MPSHTERFLCTCGKKWSVSFNAPRCRFRCKKCGLVHSLPKRSPLEAAAIAELKLEEEEQPGTVRSLAKETEIAKSMVTARAEKPVSSRLFGVLAAGFGLLLVTTVMVALVQRWFYADSAAAERTSGTVWVASADRLAELDAEKITFGPGQFQLPSGFAVYRYKPEVALRIWRNQVQAADGEEFGTIQLLSGKALPGEAETFADQFVRLTRKHVAQDAVVEEGVFQGHRCVRIKYEDAREQYAYGRFRYTFIVQLPNRRLAMTCASSVGWDTPFMELMLASVLSYQLDPAALIDEPAGEPGSGFDPEFIDRQE